MSDFLPQSPSPGTPGRQRFSDAKSRLVGSRDEGQLQIANCKSQIPHTLTQSAHRLAILATLSLGIATAAYFKPKKLLDFTDTLQLALPLAFLLTLLSLACSSLSLFLARKRHQPLTEPIGTTTFSLLLLIFCTILSYRSAFPILLPLRDWARWSLTFFADPTIQSLLTSFTILLIVGFITHRLSAHRRPSDSIA